MQYINTPWNDHVCVPYKLLLLDSTLGTHVVHPWAVRVHANIQLFVDDLYVA